MQAPEPDVQHSNDQLATPTKSAVYVGSYRMDRAEHDVVRWCRVPGPAEDSYPSWIVSVANLQLVSSEQGVCNEVTP